MKFDTEEMILVVFFLVVVAAVAVSADVTYIPVVVVVHSRNLP